MCAADLCSNLQGAQVLFKLSPECSDEFSVHCFNNAVPVFRILHKRFQCFVAGTSKGAPRITYRDELVLSPGQCDVDPSVVRQKSDLSKADGTGTGTLILVVALHERHDDDVRLAPLGGVHGRDEDISEAAAAQHLVDQRHLP